jgi:O-antigen ligase
MRGLEPAVVLAVAFVTIFAERLGPVPVIVALASLLLLFILRQLIAGQITTPSLANVPLALFLLLLVGTCWVTPSWQHTWPEMARVLSGMAVYLAVINWINPLPGNREPAADESHQFLRRLIEVSVVFLGLGVSLTAIGLLGMQPTYKFERLGRLLELLPRIYISGTSGFNSNNVAGVIVLFAPMAVALTLGPLQLRRRSVTLWLLAKIAVGLLSLFFGVSLLLTQTRGAWLAFGAALVLLLSLLGRRGWIVLALSAALAITLVNAIGPANLLDQMTVRDPVPVEQSLLYQDRNVSARVILWKRALHGIADAPFTGMGLGAFEIVSQQPYPQVEGFEPDPDMSHVHNIVLQTGVDFGVPGIIALVALLIIMSRLVVFMIRRSAAPSFLHTWSLGLLGSLVAFLVYNMANATTLGSLPAFVVWFLFGLCVGAGERAQSYHHSVAVHDTDSKALLPQATGFENERTEWENRAWAATAGSHNP